MEDTEGVWIKGKEIGGWIFYVRISRIFAPAENLSIWKLGKGGGARDRGFWRLERDALQKDVL